MLTVSEIKTFIDKDASSTKKRRAMEGRRYYEADHDIKGYRIFFIDADGKILQKATSRSVIRFSGCWWISKYSTCFPAKTAL